MGASKLHLRRGELDTDAAGLDRLARAGARLHGRRQLQLVPDNPKVGVTCANWYEPGLNRTYLDLATHYRTAILPARPRRPA